LTKLGVGRRVQAEFLVDGQRVLKDLVVTAAPPDYKSAPAWKWTAGGISVCDLTDDVRETLALEDDAPGVVEFVLFSSTFLQKPSSSKMGRGLHKW
jgi:hypothetical protein